MDEPIKSKVVKGNTVELHYDQDAQSPREDDNLGTMVAWHRNYTCGDEKEKWDCPTESEDFWKWAKENKAVILPTYLYDHSGITMNTTGFSCPWDSGQVGWIYILPERIFKECSPEGVTSNLTKDERKKERELAATNQIKFLLEPVKKAKGTALSRMEQAFASKKMSWAIEQGVKQYLVGEVEAYDRYIKGEYVGYTITDKAGEYLDSCWGYDDEKYAWSEALAAARAQ